MRTSSIIVAIGFLLAFGVSCSGDDGECSGHEGGEHESGGEHGEGGDGEEGEEEGTQLDPDQTHDEERKGTHLVLSFDADSNRFVGTIENVTGDPIEQIRVEIHLSNGTELGPTPDISLDPGEMDDIELDSTQESFTWWSAHAEVGKDEHSSDCE